MRRVDIPGGTAMLREDDELTVGQKRLMANTAVAAGALMAKLPATREELAAFNMMAAGFTFAEMELFDRAQDGAIVARLASWTLDAPLPTMDTINEVPASVIEALGAATVEMLAAGGEQEGGSFGPDGVEDPNSPIGASDA